MRGNFEMRLGLTHAPPQERGTRERLGVLGAAPCRGVPTPTGLSQDVQATCLSRGQEGEDEKERARVEGQASKGGRVAEPSSVDGHAGPVHQLRQLAVSRRTFRKEIKAKAPHPLFTAWEEICNYEVQSPLMKSTTPSDPTARATGWDQAPRQQQA